MSGLSTDRKGGNNIYLKVMNGKLVQTVKEGTEKAVERLNKEGVKVWELLFTALTAKITNVAFIDGKFGKELEIKCKTENQSFVIQTPANGGYAYGFLTRMGGLDLAKDTEIRPYAIPNEKDPTKTNHVIVLYQDGKKILSQFTKEDPKGLPEIEKLKKPDGSDFLKDGKPVWDDAKRMQFFDDLIYGTGGINDALIALYGTPEQVANNEDPNDFLESNEASETKEEVVEQTITAETADNVAKNDVNDGKGSKKPAKKK